MRARTRDRYVYLRSHPVLFAALALTRRVPVLRLGGTVVVQGTEEYREALTAIPLDRTAPGTTGAAVRDAGGGALFDEAGPEHRLARRALAESLAGQGVRRLRPVWLGALDRRLAPLAAGGTIDVVPVAAELAAVTVAALLDLDVEPLVLARAACDTAAAHAPGLRHRRAGTGTLLSIVDSPRDAMVAVAGIVTTVAAVPRAVAWCADDSLWSHAARPDQRAALVTELIRVTAPTPLLPRVAAADATLAGQRIRRGDRLILLARHAMRAHRDGPDPLRPAPARLAQLAFGAGTHACPGAALARAQLDDVLAALAPYRPVVVRARADRRSALPGWASLVIRPGT